jgi:hypothetical protein
MGLYSGSKPCVTPEVGGRSIPKAARGPIAAQSRRVTTLPRPTATRTVDFGRDGRPTVRVQG